MKNRHGHDVVLDNIEKTDYFNSGYEITLSDLGTTFFLSEDELEGFRPQMGDAVVLFTTNFSFIQGVIIENKVVRYSTKKESELWHQRVIDEIRLKKLEEYVKYGDDLKERVRKLPAPLRQRMNRFAEEDGVEFWIESAPYEMAAMEGAAALLNKTEELGIIAYPDDPAANSEASRMAAIDWIEEWWNINSKEHDPPYDYKKQMELVPDFGDGHSGFTASAAKMMAIEVLKVNPV